MKSARPRYCLAVFSDGFVPIVSLGQTYNIDNEVLTVSGNSVNRQRVIACSPTNPNGKQEVASEGAAMVTDGGLAPFRLVAGTSVPTVVKGAPGRLCRVLVVTNTPLNTTLTFYDNASGATSNQVAQFTPAASDSPAVLQIQCVNGITVVPGAATSADVLIEFL